MTSRQRRGASQEDGEPGGTEVRLGQGPTGDASTVFQGEGERTRRDRGVVGSRGSHPGCPNPLRTTDSGGPTGRDCSTGTCDTHCWCVRGTPLPARTDLRPAELVSGSRVSTESESSCVDGSPRRAFRRSSKSAPPQSRLNHGGVPQSVSTQGSTPCPHSVLRRSTDKGRTSINASLESDIYWETDEHTPLGGSQISRVSGGCRPQGPGCSSDSHTPRCKGRSDLTWDPHSTQGGCRTLSPSSVSVRPLVTDVPRLSVSTFVRFLHPDPVSG